MTDSSQQAFNNAQQTVQQVLSSYNAGITTKKGSVIRQLIVRPAAAILTWFKGQIDTYIKETSVSYLSTSQATQNELADLVASNYFVTRKDGSKAGGIITLTLSSPTARIPAGTPFTVDSHVFQTQSTIVISPDTIQDTDTVSYTKSILISSGVYKANIPVLAQTAGHIEIPVGAQVTYSAYLAGITGAQLLSAITGGGDVETDAEMMARARRTASAAAVGTRTAIGARLQGAPVAVLGFDIMGGQYGSLFRARNNNLLISRGGMADAYVKTQNQPSTAQVIKAPQVSSESGYNRSISLTAQDLQGVAGAIRVQTLTKQDGTPIPSFHMEFGTTDTVIGAYGARLSSHQNITIYYYDDQAIDGSITVGLIYMPGIYAIQQYLDEPQNSFIGLDILVKAALPVSVSLTCSVTSTQAITQDMLTAYQDKIAQLINDLPVGARLINFSDIKASFQKAYPQCTLRLPCSMEASISQIDGSLYTFSSQTGLLDIEYRNGVGYWDSKAYFFSATNTSIRLTVE